MPSHPDAILLYDGDCPLCCQLAQWVDRRTGGLVAVEAWQAYAARMDKDEPHAAPADRLRILADGALHEGDAAWTWLLERHPDLEALNWMAMRLGWQGPVVRAVRGAADLLKRLCRHCGRRGIVSRSS